MVLFRIKKHNPSVPEVTNKVKIEKLIPALKWAVNIDVFPLGQREAARTWADIRESGTTTAYRVSLIGPYDRVLESKFIDESECSRIMGFTVRFLAELRFGHHKDNVRTPA